MPMKIPNILTMVDMKKSCREATPETYGKSGAISELRPPFSKEFDGSDICFHFDDGTVLEYKFKVNRIIEWNENGGAFTQEYCEVLESTSEGLFLIHHLRTHTIPNEAATIVFDNKSGLVAWVRDIIGAIHSNRDISRDLVFGVADHVNTDKRYGMTDELLGTVIDWKYADDVKIHQIYETIECCAFVSPPPIGAPDWDGFFITFNPTKYVKIRDHVYLVSFYAPGSSGMEVTLLMDLNKMRQVGSVFGFDMTDTLKSYTFGAKGAYAPIGFIGQFTI